MDRLLSRSHPAGLPFVVFAGTAAFCAYFSMYAFRKPFAAARFEAMADWPFEVDFKLVIVIAQVFGYALSKVIGIKIVSENKREGRGLLILMLIGMSWAALVGFALAPPILKPIFLFLNGLPLGLIWGLVFAYLEGRRTTELLGAMLCASFIVSSGTVKAVGAALIAHAGVTELWMPAATGAVFMPLLIVSVWGLTRLPPPDPLDEHARTRRQPMAHPSRAGFMARHGVGIGLLVAAYVLFTVLRDLRDTFAAELWAAVGLGDVPAVFALSEIPIAGLALIVLGTMMLIRDNGRALMVMHGTVIVGAAVIAVSTAAFQMGVLGPMAWMILSGAGLYVAYTPFNAMLFDRLIAAVRISATAGFLIYLADASGYAASVALLVLKAWQAPDLDWLTAFIGAAYGGAGLAVVLVAAAARYFYAASALAAPSVGVKTRAVEAS